MMMRLVHQHHEIVHVDLQVVGPTVNEWRVAQAKRRMDALCIYPWEPGMPFPTGARIDVRRTWEDRG